MFCFPSFLYTRDSFLYLSHPNTHTHTYTPAHTHSYTHIHMHTHTHTNSYTYTHIHIYSHSHTHTHHKPYTYTYIYMYTYTYIYICIYIIRTWLDIELVKIFSHYVGCCFVLLIFINLFIYCWFQCWYYQICVLEVVSYVNEFSFYIEDFDPLDLSLCRW